MPGLIINPRARIFHGHDWIYTSEIKKSFGNPEDGDVISLKDFKDRPLGTAIFNSQSQIVARRFSRRKQDLNLDFFQRRIERAAQYRQKLGLPDHLQRLIWSESDGLPGVIIDRYGHCLVLQTLTLGMDMRKDLIVEALVSHFADSIPDLIIYLRNDSPSRKAEGLEDDIRVLHGSNPTPFHIEADGVIYEIDLLNGQKTGLYLDQLNAYQELASHAKGKRVLDCFSNQGGFGLACAKAGASYVKCLDVSETAIDSVKKNAELNELEIDAEAINVFDYFTAQKDATEERQTEEYDLIILDPPSFTRSKKTVTQALKGYKELHLRALKMLKNGGILSTYSCSHHVSRSDFLNNIQAAATDAKKSLRLLETHRQRPDHPIIIGLPETEYLKGFTFEVIPAW